MRLLTTWVGLLLLLLTSACQSPDQTAEETTSPIQGTWQLVHQRLSTPDTTMELTAPSPPATKVVNATHFATGRQVGDSLSAGGGRYHYAGSTYTEIIQYHSSVDLVGDSITYKSRLEDDTTWVFSGALADSVELEETWRRVE